MRYVLTLLITAASIVASLAALNWTIDPAGLFRKTTFGQQFAKALLESNYGLVIPPSLDEREFKAELAKHSRNYECIVIGSSRVMQIGSLRKYRAFPKCENILNLGVSGAVIQDHVVLVWLALSESGSKTLFLGVDPWTFAMGNDERWKIRYAESYPMARSAIDGERIDNSTSTSRWSNLVSAQYSKRSLDRLLGGVTNRQINVAPQVDEDIGEANPIVLPDGSYVYSADAVSKAKTTRVPVGGAAYKTDGVVNDIRAIELYRRMLLWAKARGAQPVLLLTPYHQNVWLFEGAPNVKAMALTEKITREIGRELNLPVVGSYRPDVPACAPDQFYDFMHPMASCVAKLAADVQF